MNIDEWDKIIHVILSLICTTKEFFVKYCHSTHNKRTFSRSYSSLTVKWYEQYHWRAAILKRTAEYKFGIKFFKETYAIGDLDVVALDDLHHNIDDTHI